MYTPPRRTPQIWIDNERALETVAQALEDAPFIGVDTEFVRERTYFPQLCVVQIATPDAIWCIDALAVPLDALAPAFRDPARTKTLHAARQDLETLNATACSGVKGIFDTQIGGACVGFKMQSGYAELAKGLLGVDITKDQTRTDWARRPLSEAQLAYAAEDVRHLEALTAALNAKLRELGREHWVREECALLEDPALYSVDPSQAWTRIKAMSSLGSAAQRIGRALAEWRERTAMQRNLPRAWVLADRALIALANARPQTVSQLNSLLERPTRLANVMLELIRNDTTAASEETESTRPQRPDAEQRAQLDGLARMVDARAAELNVSPELLATRADLKRLMLGEPARALRGWRREVIGLRLQEAIA